MTASVRPQGILPTFPDDCVVTSAQCDACGACDKGRQTGICPLLSCPKRMLNGPCGGMRDGMCELGDRPCIHVTARRRLVDVGRPLPGIIPALDHSIGRTPTASKAGGVS